MRPLNILIITLISFLFIEHSYAQDTEFVYKDSSIITMDSANLKSLIAESKKQSNWQPDDGDTILIKQRIKIINDSAEALKKKKVFAYAKNLDSLLKDAQKSQVNQNLGPSPSKNSRLENFFSSSLTKIFFWSLATLFVGIILYKLILAESIFQKRKNAEQVNILQASAEGLSTTTDYQILINQSVNNKNYRMAIRYFYLLTLQKLAAKGVIQFLPEKTNAQYITELSGTNYRENFLMLTSQYENAWYGGFTISPDMFERIQNNFTIFYNQL